MKVIKVLGDEKCYLMDNGQKIPFKDKHLIFQKRVIQIATPEQTKAVTKKRKKRMTSRIR